MSTSPERPLESLKWGAGHPALLVLIARTVVAAAPALHGVLEILRTGKLIENLPPLPPIREWLALYREHARLHDFVADEFCPSSDPRIKNSQFCRTLAKNYRRFCRMSVEQRKQEWQTVTPAEWREAVKSGQETVAALQQDQAEHLRCDIAGGPPPGDDVLWERVCHQSEMQFFFRVWMPCILLYGEYPTELMKRARHGDIDPMCDLLRLDKAVIAEPRIAEEFVNEPQTAEELAAIRRSVNRGSPFGGEEWQKQVVEDWGLESTLRPREGAENYRRGGGVRGLGVVCIYSFRTKVPDPFRVWRAGWGERLRRRGRFPRF
jgi:hypothetical protein